jgi:hypothetical protein
VQQQRVIQRRPLHLRLQPPVPLYLLLQHPMQLPDLLPVLQVDRLHRLLVRLLVDHDLLHQCLQVLLAVGQVLAESFGGAVGAASLGASVENEAVFGVGTDALLPIDAGRPLLLHSLNYVIDATATIIQ